MPRFEVYVTIENKPGISDPEGQTILNDLIMKGGSSSVSDVKTAKMLKFIVKEKNQTNAKQLIQKICDDLRIYNPMVSKISIDVMDA